MGSDNGFRRAVLLQYGEGEGSRKSASGTEGRVTGDLHKGFAVT